MTIRGLLRAAVLSLCLAGAAAAQAPEPKVTAPAAEPGGAPAAGVRLVLFVVVDQATADRLERYRPLYTGGLARLYDESAVFTAAHHGHAATLTATGHASLATGVHPRRHGIVGNGWYDRESGRAVEAVDDDRYGKSPRRLLAPTLGDWMKRADPASKVFAISGKDRSALFTAGREADGAFWFDDDDGFFDTTSFYGGAAAVLERLERRPTADRFFGQVWEPLTAAAAAAQRTSLASLDRGELPDRFPHPLGGASLGPDPTFYRAVYDSPFIDGVVAELGRRLIEQEGLGADEHPDFLGVLFSGPDAVGHRYGPDSPEYLDAVLRLDGWLGELLDFVDRTIGLGRVLVSFSADHGVQPIPEVMRRHDPRGRRYAAPEIDCFQRIERELDRKLGERDWLEHGFYLDRDAVPEAERPAVEEAVRGLLGDCPGVRRVWTRGELEGPPAADPMGESFRNGFHAQRSADFLVLFEEFTLSQTTVETNHGSPWPYDTHVPWLLRLPDGRGRRVEERVLTVDVAPTLARLLGLATPETDGLDRTPLLP